MGAALAKFFPLGNFGLINQLSNLINARMLFRSSGRTDGRSDGRTAKFRIAHVLIRSTFRSSARFDSQRRFDYAMGKKSRKEKKEKKEKNEKQIKKEKKEKKEKRENKDASAVATPPKDGVHPVSIEARDDEPGADDVDREEPRNEAGTREDATRSADESYYSCYEDEEAEDEQHCNNERAKFRGAGPDDGDSSDESSSRGDSPLKDARRSATALSREIKAARDTAAKTRPHGSAVAEPSSIGSTVVSSARASSSIGSTVVSSARASSVKDSDGEWYGRRDGHQNLGGLGGFGANDSRAFRERQKRKGSPNQRDGELHMPQSVWMVDRDCPAEVIDAGIFGENAKHPFVSVIFIDMAIDEQSTAHDHLCKLADTSIHDGVSCSDSKKADPRYRGPKKSIHRLGRQESTYGFAVIHNRWVSQAMYEDHQSLHSASDDVLRFGTLHVSLAPCAYDPQEKIICMGIVSVRRFADSVSTIDKSDAQVLAKWTERETHDMVIACAGRDTCAVDTWKYFGEISGAKRNCPLYQPVKKPRSAVAPEDSSDGDSFKRAHKDFSACPQMVFLYGDCTKVNTPFASQIKPFAKNSIREGRLLECVVDQTEIPLWVAPPSTDLAHRQALGEVSIKAIQWEQSPDGVLPLYIWFDHPSKFIVNDADATTTDKGKKGKDADKGKGKHKDSGNRIDKDDGKRTRIQQSQQQRLQSVTQTSAYPPPMPPPPFPPPSHEPTPRRQARLASPQRRSRDRHQSRSSREPRTPSPSPGPWRKVLKPHARYSDVSAVATTQNVQRPRVELYPQQNPRAAVAPPTPRRSRSPQRRPKSAVALSAPRRRPSPERRPESAVARSAPRRSPSPERRIQRVRRSGTIADEFADSTADRVPEDPVDRAKYISSYTPEFIRNYRKWVAEAPEERGPLLDGSVSSEEDDTGIVEADCEFVPMDSRNSTRGESSRRSRSPLRTRRTRPPASEQRRPPAQYVKPPPWATRSRMSQSVRAEASEGAESSERAVSPVGRSGVRSHSHAPGARGVVMSARKVDVYR